MTWVRSYKQELERLAPAWASAFFVLQRDNSHRSAKCFMMGMVLLIQERMERISLQTRFVAIGSLSAFLSVALGAFGAHLLKDTLPPDMLSVYQTGVQYQMMHSIGLIALGIAAAYLPRSKLLVRAGWAMLTGIVLFSGSLYALSITQIKILGAITPLGGVAFLVAWGLFAAAALKRKE
jgi:uncharacterized membrane protein YgdD (TMEM256/DUF423 family)